EFKEKFAGKAVAQKKKIGFDGLFTFLTVGSIEKTKRFDLLIRVFCELEKSYHHIGLIIVGEGDELDSLKALARGSEHIYFSGARFEDVGLFYSMADVFVLPGLGGLAINEAMAYGLPVISAPADGTELDLILDGETGFLIGMNAEEELREKLEWCIRHPERVKEMGRRAREFVASHYSLENMIRNFKRAIRLAISAKGRG
ncbi:MAG: glycosyltransferase family 4 protein, partial [Calditrichia bacterium]